jgi:hypothetical protein
MLEWQAPSVIRDEQEQGRGPGDKSISKMFLKARTFAGVFIFIPT